MWIKILHSGLGNKPLHAAVRETDGQLLLLGSDIAKILKYKNTAQFNRMYCNVRLRDILRPQLRHRSWQDQSWLVEIETLTKHFYSRRETKILKRMMVDGEASITEFVGSYRNRPSMDKKQAQTINIGDKCLKGYDFSSFLKSFHRKSKRMMDRAAGILELKATGDSRPENAPDNCHIKFGDGRRVMYKRVKSGYSDFEDKSEYSDFEDD